jgi:hypothetical protein
MCYLINVSHGLLFQSLLVTSLLRDAVLRRIHLLYCPTLEL